MARVQRGDKACFATLIRRHLDALYSYAMRLSRSPASAEDLVQETCLAAWQHASRYRPKKARVTTWLHSILHNKFVDAMRKSAPEYDNEAVAAALAEGSTDSHVVTTQQQQMLLELIGDLPIEQRSAILLTYMQSFSNREVAQIMNISPRALESLLARARVTLKDKASVEPAPIQPVNTI